MATACWPLGRIDSKDFHRTVDWAITAGSIGVALAIGSCNNGSGNAGNGGNGMSGIRRRRRHVWRGRA
jgi:hypothetical protein